MDISDPSSINSSDLDTMGNILASSNENNSQVSATDQSINTTQEDSGLTTQNIEVTECQNENIPGNSSDNAKSELDSFADNMSTQDIDLIIMGKPSGSVTEEDPIPQTSSATDNLNISESDDNVDDLWLEGQTRELVKVETDEDFEVIVKSLETAIVETERYDIESVIEADKAPILSPILVSASIVEPVCGSDPVISSDSLLDDLSKELVPSPLITPSLSEMAEHGEQIMLSDNVELTDDITKELEAEASKLQHEDTDTQDQCLENLINTSLITNEFSTITDDIQETFDEQSSSLFEAADSVTEITENIESQPSLLELQEADMVCDIAEEINREMDEKDILPLIKDAVFENSVDSTDEMLNNIVNKSLDSEVMPVLIESQIEEAIDKEVDDVLLEFPGSDNTDINDENSTETLDDILNKSIDMEEKTVEDEESFKESEVKLVEEEESLKEPKEKFVEEEESLKEPKEKLVEEEESLKGPEEKLVEEKELLKKPEEKLVKEIDENLEEMPVEEHEEEVVEQLEKNSVEEPETKTVDVAEVKPVEILETKPVELCEVKQIAVPEVKHIQASESKLLQEHTIEDKHVEKLEEIHTETREEKHIEEQEEKVAIDQEETSSVEMSEKAEENIENVLIKTDKSDSECEDKEEETVLTKEIQIMQRIESKSDVDTQENIIPEVNVQNITDVGVRDKTEAPPIDVFDTTSVENIAKNDDQSETIQEDVTVSALTEPVQEENERNVVENIAETEIFDNPQTYLQDTDSKAINSTEENTLIEEVQSVQAVLEETPVIIPKENLVEAKLETESEQVKIEESENSAEQMLPEILEENNLPVMPEDTVDQVPVILEDSLDKSPVVLKESENNVSVILNENVTKKSDILDENIDNTPGTLEENIDYRSVTVEDNIENTPVTVEENMDNTSVTVEENIDKSPVTVEESIDKLPEQTVTEESTSLEVNTTKTIIEEQVTESITEELKTDIEPELEKDNEDSIVLCSSSTEIQPQVIEDEIKPGKHMLEADEKEQSPPKKIKLIREKLYIPPVNVCGVAKMSTLCSETSKDTEEKSEYKNTENITISTEKPTKQIGESTNVSDLIEEVKEQKTIIEGKTTSPIRSRKLKLNRNYEPEEVVSKPALELFKSEDSVTKDKLTEEITQITADITKQEDIKSSVSEDINMDDITSHSESKNIKEIIPIGEKTILELVISNEEKKETEKQNKDLEENKVIGLVTETELKEKTKLELDKDAEMDTKMEDDLSANTVLEVDDKEVKGSTSDNKSGESLLVEPEEDMEVNIPTASKETDVDDVNKKEVNEVPTIDSANKENIVTSAVQEDSEITDIISVPLESDGPTTKEIAAVSTEEINSVCLQETSVTEQDKSVESPEKPTVRDTIEMTSAEAEEITLTSPEIANLRNSKETILPISVETPALSEKISEETSIAILEEKSSTDQEEITLTASESSLTEETKSSILKEQITVKDDNVSSKAEKVQQSESITAVEQIVTEADDNLVNKEEIETIESIEPPIKEYEATIEKDDNEILQAASDVEQRDEFSEVTIEDEIMQAAKEVETRIELPEITTEENEDELKQAAQEAETRSEQSEATVEEQEEEFSEKSMGICEDEIIAVTQALEMERAKENLTEITKTESLLEICGKQEVGTVLSGSVNKELEKESSIAKVAEIQPSLVEKLSTDQQDITSQQKIIVEKVEQKIDQKIVSPNVREQQLVPPKVVESKLKRYLEDMASTSAVVSKKTKSNKDEEIKASIVKKLKSSPIPVIEDTVKIGATEDGSRQSVTIEPVISQTAIENVGKLRISRRKHDVLEPILSKSVTITKPLRVEVDDLGNSSISPSYYGEISGQKDTENIPKIVIKPIPKPEERSSPKITIKPIVKPPDTVLSPKTSKSRSSDDSCTPRITIKPIVKPDPLKITITKQKTDDTHSILKIYKPDDSSMQLEDHHVPKLTIKPIQKSDEMQHSPRITIKPVKPPSQHSPSTSISPKITVKPVVPPSDMRMEMSHSPKITVKPVINPEESYPKVTIKPILRPEDTQRAQLSPRQIKLKSMTFESSSGVTVEPISMSMHSPSMQNIESQLSPLKISVKPFAKMEDTLSPKLTIKPITKTCEIVQSEDGSSNPLKLTIKPILKPEESYQSPKITIKPIMKPEKPEQTVEEADKPERIILKIQKTNLPSPKERPSTHSSKESRKEPEVKIEAIMQDSDRNQKLDKIKLKLTKEGSHAQIIPSIPSMLSEQFSLKRPLLFSDTTISEKRSKTEFSGTEILHTSDISINLVEPNAKPNPKSISEEVTIVKLDRSSSSVAPPLAEHISQSKFKEMLLKIQQKADITCTPHIEQDCNSSSSDDVKIVGVGILSGGPLKDPLSIHDESNSQDVMIVNEVINTNPFHNVQIINAHTVTEPSAQQTPKKRGRPRKNPLEVKPEIKGEDCVEVVRPKRTCRAPPGRTPFAVKERKPRGAGRARGAGRGRGGARSPPKSPKEPKTPRGKALKEAKALAKLEAAKLAQEVVIDEITIEDSTNDTTPIATPVPPPVDDTPKKLTEIKEPSDVQMVETDVKLTQISEELLKEPQPPPVAVYEEETRMSADNSRAQTPARQVVIPPQLEGPEESQSSVQSSATTESNKNKKGRLEVCDPDSAVTGVEQIVEYSWGGGGTYMLQEQIAQFLGVKSFKRKYPGLTRRPVEMQERDYIREKGLVSESMCDMGLTAVPSSEILDIMYTDFQEKYEEYRKCMRDKQSKEISNKQKAISLATSQEKNKIDFKERAIRSAANWNVNFNKARKESRRCCMDLQTFTINFPLGRTQPKVPQKNPVGHYPIALVPGQFTDYYKPYTSNELHYLPLNTVRYGPVMPNQHCADGGQSDGSQSDSDSSSGSDSDSSDDSMSTIEDTPSTTFGKPGMNLSLSTPKAKVH